MPSASELRVDLCILIFWHFYLDFKFFLFFFFLRNKSFLNIWATKQVLRWKKLEFKRASQCAKRNLKQAKATVNLWPKCHFLAYLRFVSKNNLFNMPDNRWMIMLPRGSKIKQTIHYRAQADVCVMFAFVSTKPLLTDCFLLRLLKGTIVSWDE